MKCSDDRPSTERLVVQKGRLVSTTVGTVFLAEAQSHQPGSVQ